ncbi:unnamed protein product [Pedinophyceae sp. YPF-701]|nr:unnamed protein product [Pedinophyceae sp. YPF-701]
MAFAQASVLRHVGDVCALVSRGRSSRAQRPAAPPRGRTTRSGRAHRRAAGALAPSTGGGAGVPEVDFTEPAPHLTDGAGRRLLKGLQREELVRWCAQAGEADPARRAAQLWRWMYADGRWARSFEETAGKQDGFSAQFREAVSSTATLDGGLQLLEAVRASDGTTKLVFAIPDGPAAGGRVETVLIPVTREAGKKRRVTLCVSSQIGCAMGCKFCYTGKMGLRGNLSAAQIVEQVVAARRYLAEQPDGDPRSLTNVVFMGMGEPLHNLGSVMSSIEVMCDPSGLHISRGRVTVSTVGLIEGIRAFCQDARGAQLAVSLHATTDDGRSSIVPANNRHRLPDLIATLEELFPRGGRRFVLIEYTMLAGVNDDVAPGGDADRLAELLRRVECKVNLIVFNTHEGAEFAASPADRVAEFRGQMIRAGYVCTVRDSRGEDGMSACGQLGASLAQSPS